MKNGNKIIQRTGNEVTGTVRVQVSFCIQVFFFIFPVPCARCPHWSIVVAIFEVSSILPYDAVYRPQCHQLSKALEADYGSTSDEKQWLNFDLKWLKIKTVTRSGYFLAQFQHNNTN